MSYHTYRTSDRDQLFDEYVKCGLVTTAANRTGINVSTARNWLIAAGLHKPKSKRMSAVEIAEMRRLRYDEGCTIRTLGRIFGRSETTVRKYCQP